ncbi:MAG: GIY-YIG nuclease family protein [Sedimentibacter sp.]
MDKKKELKEKYKQMKSKMGIFVLRFNGSEKYFLETTQNLKGKMNSTKFQLQIGSHRNKELQNEWNLHGENNCIIQVLEKLQYDKDETKTDYSEELAILKIIWEEKLKNI